MGNVKMKECWLDCFPKCTCGQIFSFVHMVEKMARTLQKEKEERDNDRIIDKNKAHLKRLKIKENKQKEKINDQ